MAVKRRDPFSNIVACAFCVFLLISTASAYDGPAGVTFRAPFIAGAAGSGAVSLEAMSVRVKVRIDHDWSLKTDGKGRAFPEEFVATTADSQITFNLCNRGGKKAATHILIPFDASGTPGTGFTEPVSIHVLVSGRQAGVFKGPELARGMMKLRSFRVPVEIPAKAAAQVRIIVSHPLGMNPAWYRFICTDRFARFPNYRSLTPAGCGLEFEFAAADEKLIEHPFEFEWKTASQKEPVTEKKQGTIQFRGDSTEWVRVTGQGRTK